MATDAASATFLLPARVRFGGQAMPQADRARRLGRADRSDAEAGERAQLLRHFELLPRGWPVAAITRAFDANDANARRVGARGSRVRAARSQWCAPAGERRCVATDAGRSRCVRLGVAALVRRFGHADRCTASCALVSAPAARGEVAVDGLARGSARRGSVRPSARRAGRPSLARLAQRGAGAPASAPVERAAPARRQAAGEFAVVLGRRRVAGPRDDAACAGAIGRSDAARAGEGGEASRASTCRRSWASPDCSTCARCATCGALDAQWLQPALRRLRMGDARRRCTWIAKTARASRSRASSAGVSGASRSTAIDA